jgi:predicted naringenin-chalcone synthase
VNAVPDDAMAPGGENHDGGNLDATPSDDAAARAPMPSVRAIATAVPRHRIDRAEWMRLAATLGDPRAPRALLERLAERTAIDARGCAAFDPSHAPLFVESLADRRPGTAARMARWSEAARPLAVHAAREALSAARLDAARVTHVVTASCTGFEAPGVDLAVFEALGIPRGCRRVHIGFMGCHAAINALAVARDAARSDPAACVLVVCVEVSSVHFHGSARPDQIVADALFADGAAAFVVLGADAASAHDAARTAVADTPARADADSSACACDLRLEGAHSVVLPDSRDDMRWQIGDHGFEMTLGARVPEILRGAVGPWVRRTLESAHSLGLDAVRSWAIHPGGPRVLDSVLEGLALPPSAGDDSRAVLREHGNMSSATIGFILARLARAPEPGPIAALAFGPGLVGELLVLRRASPVFR